MALSELYFSCNEFALLVTILIQHHAWYTQLLHIFVVSAVPHIMWLLLEHSPVSNNIMWPHYVHHTLHSAGDVTIPGGMTFTVDSDLNGESPQFTLTCTSTGGPATTVTWTRDSETVSGGMTVLDDPVTAQYSHTLTVTGRLGGQYRCTVSNNKPSQDSAQFTVQGEVCM